MKLPDIRKLCDEATPGPWVAGGADEWISLFAKPNRQSECVVARIQNRVSRKPISDEDWANADFIAASRTLLPRLLKVAETLDKLDQLFEECFDHSEIDYFKTIAQRLKGGSGESWAVGHLVEEILKLRGGVRPAKALADLEAD